MKHAMRSIAAFLCLSISLNPFTVAAFSQTSSSTASAAPEPRAPVPSQIPGQIAAAHTIFLSNLGADASFPVGSDQVYSDVYKALVAWGHYKLVNSPGQADLIFQLREVSTLTTASNGDDNIYTVNNPAFQLAIVDPKSTVTLWTITSPVSLAGSKQTRARWLSISETNLISRIKVVAGEPLAPLETADLTTVPKSHGGRAALLIVGGTVAFGVGGGLLLHHFYENSLANQKAAQDAFCTANNIPLSQCAGG
jgi:hypothetical protein